jgi:nucleoside 2-deoxyribosyltransferase
MKFGDQTLDEVVRACFQPAAAKAGYELTTVIENQPAGMVDDQMRVRLRTARFVVADLTYGSRGAYWEAGFAEGLGRPVIYTCRKAEWEKEKTHFDTNHLVTIIWDPADLQSAAASLTATIRASLPEEAVMEDSGLQ